MDRSRFFLGICLFSLCAGATPALAAPNVQPPPRYQELLASIEQQRQSLAKRYRHAKGRGARRRVLDEASDFVRTAIVGDLFKAWFGTPWAFGGRTNQPREGKIACGTFVATILKHAGFRLNRIQMGRLASEHIALSLTGSHNLRRYSNRPVEEVKADVLSWGPGLYMVGLDRHAGLLVVRDDNTVRFVHSSYYRPEVGVLSEPLEGENPFADSRYRVLARLLDRRMMKTWLQGARFSARAK